MSRTNVGANGPSAGAAAAGVKSTKDINSIKDKESPVQRSSIFSPDDEHGHEVHDSVEMDHLILGEDEGEGAEDEATVGAASAGEKKKKKEGDEGADEEEEEDEEEEPELPPPVPSSSTMELSSIHPDFHDKFRPGDVQRLIQTTLQAILSGEVYDEAKVDEWIQDICAIVTEGVLSMGFQRYKIIVQTIIGELRGQSVSVGSRTLMDLKSDSGAAWTFQSDTMFATTNVYGLYYY